METQITNFVQQNTGVTIIWRWWLCE